MTSHITEYAANLRPGDLLRIGCSTNYVLVADVRPDNEAHIAVTVYDGDVPNPDGPTLHFAYIDKVDLAVRDLGPNDSNA